jgi:hypothetical protein
VSTHFIFFGVPSEGWAAPPPARGYTYYQMGSKHIAGAGTLGRREQFRIYMKAFNPTAPAREMIRAGLVIDDLHGSLFKHLAGRANLEPGSQQLLIGGIGSGKTTELLLAEKVLRDDASAISLYIDITAETDLSGFNDGALLAGFGRHLFRQAVAPLQHLRHSKFSTAFSLCLRARNGCLGLPETESRLEGWPVLQIAGTRYEVGAPLFAFFAKGGHDAACSAGFDFVERVTIQTAFYLPPQRKAHGQLLPVCKTPGQPGQTALRAVPAKLWARGRGPTEPRCTTARSGVRPAARSPAQKSTPQRKRLPTSLLIAFI